MYELVQLSGHDYYIDCPSKIGIVNTQGNDVVLIDSGSDKDAAKKVFRITEEKGWNIKAIYNTHSHADHIGGNSFIQSKTGCKIYANAIECAYTQFPELEAFTLYGGFPPKGLDNKFLRAKPSNADILSDADIPEGFGIINLPGHCFGMVGFLTPDGTAFIADSVSSRETLDKYGIGYLWDVSASLSTLENLKTIKAERFVPSHAPVCEDITELADINISAINSVKDRILSFCDSARSFDEILKMIFDSYNMKMTLQQYALISSTVRSYLTALCEEGSLTADFSDNMLYWNKL